MNDTDNDNGYTPAQEGAERAFKAASERMADAWPLPDAEFLTGISGGERHAIDRAWYDRTRRHYGGSYTRGECGRPVLYASMFPVFGSDRMPHVRWCPDCAWTVAAREGDLGRQVRALTPSPDDQAALGRLMADPLIAVHAAMMIIDAAERDHRYRIGAETVGLLAAITRHAPAVLLEEECAEGGCEHGRREDGLRSCGASAACAACSVQAGPEAGELEGMFLLACTIPAPCAPLTALAVHAEREHAEMTRREQQLAGATITGEG